MKKITFYTHLYEDFQERMDQFKNECSECQIVGASDENTLIREISDSHAVVWGNPKVEILEKAPKLEMVFIPFTGVNRLPFDYLIKRGIKVSNNHGNTPIVAERAVSLALAITGRVVEYHNDMKMGDWHRNYDGGSPFDLWTSIQKKKVTILGCGAIGKNIAKLLQGFDCEITGFKRNYTENIEGFHHITNDLEKALRDAHVIFITLPLTEGTKELINQKNSHLLKDKFIVNVARGEIIEERTLYESLKNGILKGAAIDCWYNYPNSKMHYTLPSHYPVHKLKNIVISPHAASHSVEGKLFQLEDTLMNIKAYIKTGLPVDLVDLGTGY
jgi:phosphoglycerate dehydrogenase-like enzyme